MSTKKTVFARIAHKYALLLFAVTIFAPSYNIVYAQTPRSSSMTTTSSSSLMTTSTSTTTTSSLTTTPSARPSSIQLLQRSTSHASLVETARDHLWSIDFAKRERDTVHIVAVRVQFEADDSDLTTGNGQFGMRGDVRETRHYEQGGAYVYDALPHDSAYFAHQLTALANYYEKVSRGNLYIDFSIFPARGGETGYNLPQKMTHYSPGQRLRGETIDQYWDRKTVGLMMFVRDAINVANSEADSPFRNLYRDDAGVLRVAPSGHKAAILIFHAGASYMTDGALNGQPNSPSDMINAFINRDFFRAWSDTLGLVNDGVTIRGRDGETFVINEVMTAPETSNQDGMNWGIQGILVNQLARQLGIPDLFSTSSGNSAIGAFCIMDFAGYSAGRGFITPYPSAWVRAFMGWDRPVVAAAGADTPHRVRAVTLALEGGGGG